MRDKMRWGVLGNSMIGRKCVMPALNSAPGSTIRALATMRPQAATQVAEENRVAIIYSDYQRLLEDPEIDAVYIPLPNHLHKPWAIRALEHGKHVLCEKPLACNGAEAMAMAAAAKNADRLLMEALMYRFHPRSIRVRELARSSSIGEVRMVRSSFCFRMADEILESGDNYRLKRECGGGALLDVGSYGVSLARWMFADEPVAVQAQAVFHPVHQVDMQLVASLRFRCGGLATIEAGFASGLQQTFSISGTKGVIDLPHNAYIPWDKDAHYTIRGKDDEVGRVETVPGVDEYRLMVQQFVDAVQSGAPPAVSLDDSIGNLRVLDSLDEAIVSGGTVHIPHGETS